MQRLGDGVRDALRGKGFKIIERDNLDRSNSIAPSRPWRAG